MKDLTPSFLFDPIVPLDRVRDRIRYLHLQIDEGAAIHAPWQAQGEREVVRRLQDVDPALVRSSGQKTSKTRTSARVLPCISG